MILIYVVTASADEASRLGHALLVRKLCACVNILPQIESMYWWSGKIEQNKEAVLLIKTDETMYESVEQLILSKHSYEKPAIFAIPVSRVEPAYLNWINTQIAPEPE